MIEQLGQTISHIDYDKQKTINQNNSYRKLQMDNSLARNEIPWKTTRIPGTFADRITPQRSPMRQNEIDQDFLRSVSP